MRTETFRVARLSLAYLAVAQYLRTYWWLAAIVPGFGLVAFAFGSGVLRAMGLMGILWPLALPARAIFVTGKAGRLLQGGAWASLEDDVLYLHGLGGDGLKLTLGLVRRIERRMGFLVLTLARGDFLALPLASMDEAFVSAVEAVPTFYDIQRCDPKDNAGS